MYTSVPMYVSIQRKILTTRNWMAIDEGIEIAEFEYKAQDWEKSRRMITVRQKVSERPKAAGKQLSLFEDDYFQNDYRYTCYVTTLKLSSADIWRLYRGRANCENESKNSNTIMGWINESRQLRAQSCFVANDYSL